MHGQQLCIVKHLMLNLIRIKMMEEHTAVVEALLGIKEELAVFHENYKERNKSAEDYRMRKNVILLPSYC